MLNLLHRYGDRHGLRFALPARYQFGYPRLFQASRVKGYHPEGGGAKPLFHILCHHMRFNLKEVRGIRGDGWNWRDMGLGLWPRAPGEGGPQAWGFLGTPSSRNWAWDPQFPVPLSTAVPCLVVSGSQSPAFSHLELSNPFPWPIFPTGVSALITLTPQPLASDASSWLFLAPSTDTTWAPAQPLPSDHLPLPDTENQLHASLHDKP